MVLWGASLLGLGISWAFVEVRTMKSHHPAAVASGFHHGWDRREQLLPVTVLFPFKAWMQSHWVQTWWNLHFLLFFFPLADLGMFHNVLLYQGRVGGLLFTFECYGNWSWIFKSSGPKRKLNQSPLVAPFSLVTNKPLKYFPKLHWGELYPLLACGCDQDNN